MSNKAIGYIRVSSEAQKESGLSLAHQEERIRSYCAMAGLELIDIIHDEAVSAYKPLAARPGGAQILARLGKEAQHVVALKLDRLFRNAPDALSAVETWSKRDIGLHLVDHGGQAINTTSAIGRMFLTMLAGFAQFERDLISERTAAALGQKKARGEAVSRPVVGYDTVDGKLIENAQDQALIARIKAMRGEGMSYQRIADTLNAEGVEGKRGGTWQAMTVQRIAKRAA